MAKKKQGVLVWILMGFVLVGLVGFGSAGLSGMTNSIGRVGDRPIKTQEFYNALQNQISALSRQFGVPLTFAQAQAFGVDQAVLARIVTEKALDGEVQRLGLSAGDARVGEQLRAITQFQRLDGTFNRDRYREFTRNQQMDETEFEDGIRLSLARQLLETAVFEGNPQPVTMSQFLAMWRGETRDVTWARLDAAALETAVAAPTDAEVQAEYDANPDRYTLPERHEITYAWLSPAMMSARVEVADSEIQALYDSRAAEFRQPERRLVERLVYPDAAGAEAALARLTAGETDFETLVAERGLDLAAVDLGDVAIGDLGEAGEAVFAAEPGAVVGPLPSRFGPALYRINAHLNAVEVPLEEVRDDLRDEVAAAQSERMIQLAAEDLIDLLAGGASIEEVAAAGDMQLGTISWSADVTEGIAAYDAFRAAAAAATTDDFPDLQELDDGGVFVLRLDGITPPALQPLDEIRDRVVADWTSGATAAAVLARAEELAGTIRAGGFDQPGMNLVPTVAPRLRRTDFAPGAPQALASEAFSRATGEVAVLADGEGAVILRVDAVNAADIADDAVAADSATIALNAADGLNRDIFDALATRIQLSTDVVIDQAALTSLYSQIP